MFFLLVLVLPVVANAEEFKLQYVDRPMLLQLQKEMKTTNKRMSMPPAFQSGLVVMSPIGKKLKPMDIITHINNAPITQDDTNISENHAGKIVSLRIFKGKTFKRSGFEHMKYERATVSVVVPSKQIAKPKAEDGKDEKNFYKGEILFKKLPWETDLDAIKKIPGIQKHDESKYFKETEVAGLEMLEVYLLSDGKLAKGFYILNETYLNKNSYLNNYFALKKLLTEKYGKPSTDKTTFHDTNYSEDQYGLAVSVGDLVLFSEWNGTNGTSVSIRLEGEKFKISLSINYKHEASQQKIDKQAKEQDLDSL